MVTCATTLMPSCVWTFVRIWTTVWSDGAEERTGLPDPKLPEEPFEFPSVGVLGIDAKNVNALRGIKFKTGKYRDLSTLGGTPKRRHVTHAVMIGHGEHGNAEFDGLFDDGVGV